jgi:hypothetical protein
MMVHAQVPICVMMDKHLFVILMIAQQVVMMEVLQMDVISQIIIFI